MVRAAVCSCRIVISFLKQGIVCAFLGGRAKTPRLHAALAGISGETCIIPPQLSFAPISPVALNSPPATERWLVQVGNLYSMNQEPRSTRDVTRDNVHENEGWINGLLNYFSYRMVLSCNEFCFNSIGTYQKNEVWIIYSNLISLAYYEEKFYYNYR